MKQIKKINSLIEECSEKNKTEMKECEVERYKHLVMIGNVLHPSVPISNDEVGMGKGEREREGGKVEGEEERMGGWEKERGSGRGKERDRE